MFQCKDSDKQNLLKQLKGTHFVSTNVHLIYVE